MRRHEYWWPLTGTLMTTIRRVLWEYDAVTVGEYLQNFVGVFCLLQGLIVSKLDEYRRRL